MTAVTPIRTAAEKALGEAIAAHLDGLSAPLARIAAPAAAQFATAGLPHRRIEEYHYTDLRALLRAVPPAAPRTTADAAPIADCLPADLPRHRLVFVDGRFDAAASDAAVIAGVEVTALTDALAAGLTLGGVAPEADPLVGLNSALAGDGVVIRVAAGATVEALLEIAHVTTGATLAAVRHVVELGAGARLRLIESHAGPDATAYQVNAMLEMRLADGAHATLVKLQAEGSTATHFGTLAATLGAGAELNHFVLNSGGELIRNQLFARFDGENANLATRGANLLAGRQHADTTLVVDHAVPHGQSRELYKSVIDDRAKGVFQGKIIVRPGAQKTDGRMASHSILLSDEAEVANKPELEIFADDVQCGHGATAGELDEKLKFYLMARGIPRAEAERLLVLAFLAETVEEMGDAEIGAVLTGRIEAWLSGRGR